MLRISVREGNQEIISARLFWNKYSWLEILNPFSNEHLLKLKGETQRMIYNHGTVDAY